MTAKRTGRFSLREDRQLIQMAAKSVSSEEAAAMFGSSVATIERKARKLGLPLKRRDNPKRLSARIAEVVLKAKGK
jgi:transposase